jgi:hypothetical protein
MAGLATDASEWLRSVRSLQVPALAVTSTPYEDSTSTAKSSEIGPLPYIVAPPTSPVERGGDHNTSLEIAQIVGAANIPLSTASSSVDTDHPTQEKLALVLREEREDEMPDQESVQRETRRNLDEPEDKILVNIFHFVSSSFNIFIHSEQHINK